MEQTITQIKKIIADTEQRRDAFRATATSATAAADEDQRHIDSLNQVLTALQNSLTPPSAS